MRALTACLLVGNLVLAGSLAVLVPARAQENRLQPGPGREAVIAACSDCHGLVALNGKQMDYAGWYSTIVEMMNNGASISGEDRQAAAAYLAANFGTGDAQPAAK